MEAMKKHKVFAFDFDGVIGEYSGFKGEQVLGPPNMKVVEAMRLLRERGHKVMIFSTHDKVLLRDYCTKHGIIVDYINENPTKSGANKGKPVANVYIDDRAYCYSGQNTAQLVEDLEHFQPYWKKNREG